MTLKKKSSQGFLDFVLALAMILVVIVLIVSFGRVDLSRTKNTPQKKNPSLDDRIEAIRIQHAKYERMLKSQKKLKERLGKRFKRIYFLVRCLLVAGWIGSNVGFSVVGIASTLEDFLNLNQAIIVIFVAATFLFSGGLSGISEGIKYVKNGVENIVYRKYLNLDADIESTIAHSNKLQLEKEKLEEEIYFNSKFEKLTESV